MNSTEPAKSSPEEAKGPGRVLLVEDEQVSRVVAGRLLSSSGFEVIEAEDGETALSKARDSEPDVILLDLVLPGVSGFEVCRELKGDPMTAPVPILVQTSLAERENRLQAIHAGANDFINKPFDAEDVLPRVRNAVYSKRLYDQVRDNLEKIQEMERLKENLMHMIIHDMRNPLNGVAGWVELAHDMARERLTDAEQRYLVSAGNQARNLQTLIDSLLDVSRLEHNQMPLNLQSVHLNDLAREALDHCEGISVQVALSLEEGGVNSLCRCDPDLIRRVMVNIVANAMNELSDRGDEGRVEVGFVGGGDVLRTEIRDNGPGVAAELRGRIFDKFIHGRKKQGSRTASSGLGLNFCKLAVEAHGGRIGVDSEVGAGAVFWFELPVAGSGGFS